MFQWLWEETHVLKAVGLNPGAVYWMDMTFFHIDLLQKLYCVFEKTENKTKKRPGLPHFFKKRFVTKTFQKQPNLITLKYNSPNPCQLYMDYFSIQVPYDTERHKHDDVTCHVNCQSERFLSTVAYVDFLFTKFVWSSMQIWFVGLQPIIKIYSDDPRADVTNKFQS